MNKHVFRRSRWLRPAFAIIGTALVATVPASASVVMNGTRFV